MDGCAYRIASEAGAFGMIRAVNDFDRHHVLPVGGGTLDQTPEFDAARRFIAGDRERLKEHQPRD